MRLRKKEQSESPGAMPALLVDLGREEKQGIDAARGAVASLAKDTLGDSDPSPGGLGNREESRIYNSCRRYQPCSLPIQGAWDSVDWRILQPDDHPGIAGTGELLELTVAAGLGFSIDRSRDGHRGIPFATE